jgi:hypothetical protein
MTKKEQIINLRAEGKTKKQIQSLLSCDVRWINRTLTEAGINRWESSIAWQFEKEIIQSYKAGTTITCLSKTHNCSRKFIRNLLKNAMITLRSDDKHDYKIDFAHLDTEVKAYVLGLLAADGRMYHHRRATCLKLKLDDLELLEKLRDYIQPRGEVRIYYNTNQHGTDVCEFCINNVELCQQLYSHGIIPNKTRAVKLPPNLPNYLLNHWMRGYFDGDGSVFHRNNRPTLSGLECNMTGNINIITFVKTYFNKICNSSTKIHQTGDHTFKVVYTGTKAVSFLQHIYADATIYLERKYQRALPVLEKI